MNTEQSLSTHTKEHRDGLILFGTIVGTIGVMTTTLLISTETIDSLMLSRFTLLTIVSTAAVLFIHQMRRSDGISSIRGQRITAAIAASLIALVGIAQTTGAQEVAFTTGDVVIAADSVNIRSDASVDAEIVDTLEVGDAVTITGEGSNDGTYTWYSITTDLGDGYVAGDYLSEQTVFTTGTAVSINTDTLNLRDGASLDSSVLAELTSGVEITIVGDPTVANGISWYQVDTASGSGWLAGEFLIAV